MSAVSVAAVPMLAGPLGTLSGVFALAVLISTIFIGSGYLISAWGLDGPRDLVFELAARLLPRFTRTTASLRRRFGRALTHQVLITVSGERVAFQHLAIRISPEDVRRLAPGGDIPRLAVDAVTLYAKHARREGWEVGSDVTVTVQVDPALRSGWVPRAQSIPPGTTVEGISAAIALADLRRADTSHPVLTGAACGVDETVDDRHTNQKAGPAGSSERRESSADASVHGDAAAGRRPTPKTRMAYTKVDRATRSPLLVLATDAGATHRVTQETMVGRSPEADIELDSDIVSGMHMRLYPGVQTWFAVDLHSTNGTTLDGLAMAPDMPYELKPGAELVLGYGGAVLRVRQSELSGRYTAQPQSVVEA